VPKSPAYRIREVDGSVQEIADALVRLNRLTFQRTAPAIVPGSGHWWLAYRGDEAVGFIGIERSKVYRRKKIGYFSRVGVVPKHRGNRLQVRLMRAMEARARRNGWTGIVSDTTDNPASSNSFIAGGYSIFKPRAPWAFAGSVYWFKGIS
jgi:GNAT superfamily N-acetyltransferase